MAFATKSSWPKNTDDRIARIVEMLGNTEGIVAHTKNHPTNGYIFTFIQNGMSREYWVQHSTLCGDRTLTEFFTRFGGEDLRDMLTLFADGRPPFFMTIENERNTMELTGG